MSIDQIKNAISQIDEVQSDLASVGKLADAAMNLDLALAELEQEPKEYYHASDCNPLPWKNDCECGLLQRVREQVKSKPELTKFTGIHIENHGPRMKHICNCAWPLRACTCGACEINTFIDKLTISKPEPTELDSTIKALTNGVYEKPYCRRVDEQMVVFVADDQKVCTVALIDEYDEEIAQAICDAGMMLKELEDRRANASFNERKAYEVIREKEDRVKELSEKLRNSRQRLSELAVKLNDKCVEMCRDKDKEIERLKQIIRGALAIKALWEPADSMENIDEGKALLKMIEQFEQAIKPK